MKVKVWSAGRGGGGMRGCVARGGGGGWRRQEAESYFVSLGCGVKAQVWVWA